MFLYCLVLLLLFLTFQLKVQWPQSSLSSRCISPCQIHKSELLPSSATFFKTGLKSTYLFLKRCESYLGQKLKNMLIIVSGSKSCAAFFIQALNNRNCYCCLRKTESLTKLSHQPLAPCCTSIDNSLHVQVLKYVIKSKNKPTKAN